METNLLDKMLSTYRSQKTPVTIVLQNNARITGRIGTFDSYVIVMESKRNEIIYRHAISTLLPSVAAEQPQPREQKIAPARPAPRPAPKPARHAPPATTKNRPSRPEHKTAPAPAESGLNTGMKEGLLRWMQEQKAGK
jgi:host factor-I protein